MYFGMKNTLKNNRNHTSNIPVGKGNIENLKK